MWSVRLWGVGWTGGRAERGAGEPLSPISQGSSNPPFSSSDPADAPLANLPHGSSGVAAYGGILAAGRRKSKKSDDDGAPSELAGVDADANDDDGDADGGARRKLQGGAGTPGAIDSGEQVWWHREGEGKVVMHDHAVPRTAAAAGGRKLLGGAGTPGAIDSGKAKWWHVDETGKVVMHDHAVVDG